MDQERKQISLKTRVAAIVTLGGAAVLAACGGKGENPSPPSESPTVGPSPTRTVEPTPIAVEAPTIAPTPKETATPEALPSPHDVLDLISRGLTETPVTPYQVPAVDDRDLDIISDNLAQCNKEKQPVAPFRNIGDMQTFTPDDPTYSYKVEILCQKVGRATKTLYEATKNEKFFQANRLWKSIHQDVFFFLIQEYQSLTSAQWESTVERLYSFSK